MQESTYTQSVHRHLKGRCYVWKISDRFHAGIPDAYYAGDRGALWIEYKYDPRPRGHLKPALTKLQIRWLEQHHNMGHHVAVIVGTPQGGVLYPGISWKTPIHVEDLATKRNSWGQKRLATWIVDQVGVIPAHAVKSPE